MSSLGPSLAPDTECGADHSTHITWRRCKHRPGHLCRQEEDNGPAVGGLSWLRSNACAHAHITGLNPTPALDTKTQTGPDPSKKALLTCVSTQTHWASQWKRNGKCSQPPRGQGQTQPSWSDKSWQPQESTTGYIYRVQPPQRSQQLRNIS